MRINMDAQWGPMKIELHRTSTACPEQYQMLIDGEQCAYFRLRHGDFRVDVPDCGGTTIYEAEPEGEGMFSPGERGEYLGAAIKAVLDYKYTGVVEEIIL